MTHALTFGDVEALELNWLHIVDKGGEEGVYVSGGWHVLIARYCLARILIRQTIL